MTKAGTRSKVYFIRPAASPGSDVAEDQSGTDGNGHDMDDGSDFLTQGDDPQVVAGLHAGFLQLIDDAAHQSDQHTAEPGSS